MISEVIMWSSSKDPKLFINSRVERLEFRTSSLIVKLAESCTKGIGVEVGWSGSGLGQLGPKEFEVGLESPTG